MPELPEVETVIRTLELQLKEQQIIAINLKYSKIIDFPAVKLFEKRIINQHFQAFSRLGKYLIFSLDDYTWIVHLRMEGKFFIQPKGTPASKHDHLILSLSNGQQLHYNDVRKFGKMYLYKKEEEYSCLKGLGLEFFSSDMNASYLMNIAQDKRMNLKQLLLMQKYILGVGNIYADEICFAAKLHPLASIKDLQEKDWDLIIQSGKKILQEAIKAGGTTIRSYSSAKGVSGLFQLSLKVHSKEGEACLICGNTIIKSKVAGRGTYYCPNCQKHRYTLIAITGRRASGKTTVLKMFEEEGFRIIDADKIVDGLLKEKDIKANVEDLLSIKLSNNHLINKKRIAEIIFNDDLVKKEYEKMIFPLVYQKIKKFSKDLTICEVQRLYESGFNRFFEANIAVISSKEISIERLKAKGISDSDIKQREKYQIKNSYLKNKSDFLLYNDLDVVSLKKQVKKLAKILKGESL